MEQRHEAVLREFGFAAIADRDLRRTLHVDAAVIGRERVRRKTFDRAARLDPTDP